MVLLICCCEFLGIVIVKRRFFESRKFKLCDLKLLLAHFKKQKINCIFLFTFMKQLKSVRDDDERERKTVRKTKVPKGPKEPKKLLLQKSLRII
jgi:hypothetical protein